MDDQGDLDEVGAILDTGEVILYTPEPVECGADVVDGGDGLDDCDAGAPRQKKNLLDEDEDLLDASIRARSGSTKNKYAYNMQHKRRGMAIVINNFEFDTNTGLPDRKGTEQDARSLSKVFSKLEFDVRLFTDLKRRQMLKLMEEIMDLDHRDNDCFVCVILSHGEDGMIWGVDAKMRIADLLLPFKGRKCRTLAGKPKLFFFQACRGKALDPGVEVHDSGPEDLSAYDEVDAVAERVPVEADFLYAYSVVPGYYAWRNSARGSWFIQSLTQVLDKYGSSMELMQIMTHVNHKVAYEFESNAADAHMTHKKQVPCIVSMLTKQLHFTPKKM